jgi:hypothetical protein
MTGKSEKALNAVNFYLNLLPKLPNANEASVIVVNTHEQSIITANDHEKMEGYFDSLTDEEMGHVRN